MGFSRILPADSMAFPAPLRFWWLLAADAARLFGLELRRRSRLISAAVVSPIALQQFCADLWMNLYSE